MYLYVIYDKVAERSSSVFEAVNHAVARREWSRFISENEMDSDDFDMYCVGIRNEHTGLVTGFEVREEVSEVPTYKEILEEEEIYE